jgi:hypothetical protein
VERYGFLGGMGTAGGVTNFAGLYGKRNGEMTQLVHGVADDLLARIGALGGLNKPQDGMQGRIRVRSYDTSAYKIAADQLLLAAGVKLLFHAWAAAVVRDGAASRRWWSRPSRAARRSAPTPSSTPAATPTWPPSRACPSRWATATAAACSRPPCSASARSTRRRAGGGGRVQGHQRPHGRVRAQHPGTYKFPREGAILRPNIDPREWRANVTQIRNAEGRAMNGVDARELTDGELEGRRQIAEYFKFLKAEVPGFAHSAIVEIAPQVGIRETRRIEGLYALRARTSFRRPGSTTASASTPGRWRCTPTAASNGPFRATTTAPTTSCPGACWCRSGRQPAGGRPLRLDDARGPVGRARERRLLRDGAGRGHGGGVAGQREFRGGRCAGAAEEAARRRRRPRPLNPAARCGARRAR